MFSDVTGEIVDVMPASKLNDSPGEGFILCDIVHSFVSKRGLRLLTIFYAIVFPLFF